MMRTKLVTQAGLDFSEIVFEYNRNPSESLGTKILDILVSYAKGIEDPNVLLNKFGRIYAKKVTWVDPNITICNALAVLANYDAYSLSIFTKPIQYYKDEILKVFRIYGGGCSRDETIRRFAEFVQ